MPSVLRAAVPNITDDIEIDEASVVEAAIAYIEELQEQERRVLAAARTESAASVGEGCAGFPPRKPTAANPPVQILQLRVTDVGQNLAVVSVTHGNARGAMPKVCRALESLRPKVIAGSIAAVDGGTVVHTMFVETEGIDGVQRVKEMVEAALSQLDVP